jgi:hypothetical protein
MVELDLSIASYLVSVIIRRQRKQKNRRGRTPRGIRPRRLTR